MAKQAHPMKEKVIKWIVKEHDARPFRSVKEAMDAAREQFKDEELPSTLRQWAAEGTGIEGRRRGPKNGQAKQPEMFTFESAVQQIEQIKQRMVQGLMNQFRLILAQERQLDVVKQKLEQDIQRCAQLTGMSREEIDAKLNTLRT